MSFQDFAFPVLPKRKIKRFPSTLFENFPLFYPFARFICFLLFPSLFALWPSPGIPPPNSAQVGHVGFWIPNHKLNYLFWGVGAFPHRKTFLRWTPRAKSATDRQLRFELCVSEERVCLWPLGIICEVCRKEKENKLCRHWSESRLCVLFRLGEIRETYLVAESFFSLEGKVNEYKANPC